MGYGIKPRHLPEGAHVRSQRASSAHPVFVPDLKGPSQLGSPKEKHPLDQLQRKSKVFSFFLVLLGRPPSGESRIRCLPQEEGENQTRASAEIVSQRGSYPEIPGGTRYCGSKGKEGGTQVPVLFILQHPTITPPSINKCKYSVCKTFAVPRPQMAGGNGPTDLLLLR